MITYRFYREKENKHPVIKPNYERELLFSKPNITQLIIPDEMFHNYISHLHNQSWIYTAIEYDCKYPIDHLMTYVKDIENPLELEDLLPLPIEIHSVSFKNGIDKIILAKTKVEVSSKNLITSTLDFIFNDELPDYLYK